MKSKLVLGGIFIKILIIYESIHHGNTEKIAKAMAETISGELVKSSNIGEKNIMEYDLIGFGSGIYYSKLHKNIMNIIERLPEVKNKKAFVFSTSGLGKNSFNDVACKKLNEKGYEVLESFSCKGIDTFGPLKIIGGINKGRPKEIDIKRAKAFAKGLI